MIDWRKCPVTAPPILREISLVYIASNPVPFPSQPSDVTIEELLSVSLELLLKFAAMKHITE